MSHRRSHDGDRDAATLGQTPVDAKIGRRIVRNRRGQSGHLQVTVRWRPRPMAARLGRREKYILILILSVSAHNSKDTNDGIDRVRRPQ